MSNVIMVIATAVIAIFSGLSYFVAHRIHQSTLKRDNEIKEVLQQLISATLVSGPGIGEAKTMARLFKEQLKEIKERNAGHP